MFDHMAIRTGKTGHSPLKDGIEEWGSRLKMELPDLDELGFELHESRDKGDVYEILVRLVLECDSANVKVKWQIAPPGTAPYDGKLDFLHKIADAPGLQHVKTTSLTCYHREWAAVRLEG